MFFFLFLTCIVAKSLPLFSPPVHPGTEAHEDDPAGSPKSGNEGRLLHHVWDAVVVVRSRHYVPQFCTWGDEKKGRELGFMTRAQSNRFAWMVGLGWVRKEIIGGKKQQGWILIFLLFELLLLLWSHSLFKQYWWLTNKHTKLNVKKTSFFLNYTNIVKVITFVCVRKVGT